MNKILLIIIYFSLSQLNAAAQDIINGNFSINNGNDGVNCGAYGTFSDNSVPNWVRSHGTPNFHVTGTGTDNTIEIYSNGDNSEGIIGGYEFKKTRSYCVKVNLTNWGGSTESGSFKVYACSGFVRNLTLPEDYCLNSMPGLPPNAELIGTGTKQINNYFLFNPTVDNEQLLIVFLNGDGPYDFIGVKEVIVSTYCKEIITFDNGEIPAISYAATHIYAGTSAGSGSTTVSNVTNMETVLTGSQDVILQPSFDVTANGNGYFIVDIGPCPFPYTPCQIFVDPAKDKYDPDYSSLDKVTIDTSMVNNSKPLNITSNIAHNNDVLIYPNPNNGEFVIKFSRNANCEIKILNLIGVVMYESTINGEQLKKVKLNSNFPQGSYIILLRGKDFNYTKKIHIN